MYLRACWDVHFRIIVLLQYSAISLKIIIRCIAVYCTLHSCIGSEKKGWSGASPWHNGKWTARWGHRCVCSCMHAFGQTGSVLAHEYGCMVCGYSTIVLIYETIENETSFSIVRNTCPFRQNGQTVLERFVTELMSLKTLCSWMKMIKNDSALDKRCIHCSESYIDTQIALIRMPEVAGSFYKNAVIHYVYMWRCAVAHSYLLCSLVER